MKDTHTIIPEKIHKDGNIKIIHEKKISHYNATTLCFDIGLGTDIKKFKNII
jgi:hypothetical protein